MKPAPSLLILTTVSLCILLLSGCLGPKVASDLLVETPREPAPLIDNSVRIGVTMNPRINNAERIDAIVQQSLQEALEAANIFTETSAAHYRIYAHISVASQAQFSFGNFDGTLEVHYRVTGPSGNQVLEDIIFTVAGSDKFSFFGGARHRRARAVNAAINAQQFVEVLREYLRSQAD